MGIQPFNRFQPPSTRQVQAHATPTGHPTERATANPPSGSRTDVENDADPQDSGDHGQPLPEIPPPLKRPPHSRRRFLRIVRPLIAPVVWLGLLAMSAGAVVTAFFWLATIPPPPNCQKLPALAADADRLYCAERAARSGKESTILAGFALVKDWSANHPLHSRANRARREWSKALLEIAAKKADKGDLAGAIALAHKIPSNSPIDKEVKATIAGWEKQYNHGELVGNAFLVALKRQDWSTAEAKILAFARLNSDQEWRSRVSKLRRRLKTEQNARQQLDQIRLLVDESPGQVDVLTQAISQAKQVIPGTYAQLDAKTETENWGKALLDIATERFAQTDVEGAIAAAQAVPFQLTPPPALSDLVWFSRARQITASNSPPTVSLTEALFQGWETLLKLRQIQPDSPFYQQGKALMPRLELHLQDLTQLQAAAASAHLGQIPSLQAAIQMAQTISPDRPQRLYAQTLIAQWRKQIQQIEDRPNLLRAQELAKAGTIPRLQAAIAQAKLIAPQRVLRLEAQTQIVKWTRQIQTIEDRPILERAQALAKQKKLQQAIQEAGKIRAERALFKDAQTAIKNWTAQIQIAADRPTLLKAQTLGDQGNLSEAIAVASQITAGRALYEEAQELIGRWAAQQEELSQRSRRFDSEGDDYSSSSRRSLRRYRYRPAR